MKHVPPLGGYGLCSLWEIEWYAREQCLFVLRYLIASSVFDSFVHAQDVDQHHYSEATWNGHVEIAQMLMEKGANIEAMDKVQLVENVY